MSPKAQCGHPDDRCARLRHQVRRPAGASVEAVLEGSCAEKAGIQKDDIICAVDGTEVGFQHPR